MNKQKDVEDSVNEIKRRFTIIEEKTTARRMDSGFNIGYNAHLSGSSQKSEKSFRSEHKNTKSTLSTLIHWLTLEPQGLWLEEPLQLKMTFSRERKLVQLSTLTISIITKVTKKTWMSIEVNMENSAVSEDKAT